MLSRSSFAADISSFFLQRIGKAGLNPRPKGLSAGLVTHRSTVLQYANAKTTKCIFNRIIDYSNQFLECFNYSNFFLLRRQVLIQKQEVLRTLMREMLRIEWY